MIKTLWSTAVTCVLLVVIGMLAGCGSGSGSTSGTLTSTLSATDQTGGIYSVDASATYKPVSGDPTGTEIKYSIVYQGSSSTTEPGTLHADGSGTVYYSKSMVYQDIVPIIITFTATAGGLSSTKVINIPAMSALSVTPQAVSFDDKATAGATQTVAVSGGFSPYTVSSAALGDISATISGSTVTITKLTASGVTNTSTTITVTDNKGTQQSIVVGYFK